MPCQRVAQRLGQPDGFLHDDPELGINRRIGIGLMALLIADRVHGYKPCIGETPQFALHSPRAATNGGDGFADGEAAVGLSEYQPEDTLLGLGEQRIGQRIGDVWQGVRGRLVADAAALASYPLLSCPYWEPKQSRSGFRKMDVPRTGRSRLLAR